MCRQKVCLCQAGCELYKLQVGNPNQTLVRQIHHYRRTCQTKERVGNQMLQAQKRHLHISKETVKF